MNVFLYLNKPKTKHPLTMHFMVSGLVDGRLDLKEVIYDQ